MADVRRVEDLDMLNTVPAGGELVVRLPGRAPGRIGIDTVVDAAQSGTTPTPTHQIYVAWSDDITFNEAEVLVGGSSTTGTVTIPSRSANGYLGIFTPVSAGNPTQILLDGNMVNQRTAFTAVADLTQLTINGVAYYALISLSLQSASMLGTGARTVTVDGYASVPMPVRELRFAWAEAANGLTGDRFLAANGGAVGDVPNGVTIPAPPADILGGNGYVGLWVEGAQDLASVSGGGLSLASLGTRSALTVDGMAGHLYASFIPYSVAIAQSNITVTVT